MGLKEDRSASWAISSSSSRPGVWLPISAARSAHPGPSRRDRPARAGAAAGVLEPVRLRGCGSCGHRRGRAAAHPDDAAVPEAWVGAGPSAERGVESDLGGAVGNHLCRCRAGRAPEPYRASECWSGSRPRSGPRFGGSTRQLGPPAAPGEADEQGELGHRSAPAGARPPPIAPVMRGSAGTDRRRGVQRRPASARRGGGRDHAAVAVASRSGAQHPGGVHAGALLPRPELNGNAAPVPGALPRSRCCSRCPRCRCRPRRAGI